MALPAVRSSQTPARWDPFGELDEFHTRMNRWMDSVFDTAANGTGLPTWSPLADLSETEDAYLVEVEVPGIDRRDITVDLLGSELAIEGERREREREGLFRRRTRSVGRFRYSVTLPRDIDAEAVEANLSDGVLTVRVPKSESARPRRIAITQR